MSSVGAPESVGISDDEETIELHLKGGAVLAVEAKDIPMFFAAAAQMWDVLAQRGKLPSRQTPTFVQRWQIGRPANGDVRKMVALRFNEGLQGHATWLMPDFDALSMADAIEQAVLKSLSKKEQAEIFEAVERERRGDKLILPPHLHKKPN